MTSGLQVVNLASQSGKTNQIKGEQSKSKTDKNSSFISLLKNNKSALSSKKAGKLDSKKIAKLQKLLNKDLNKVTEEDLEELLSLLNTVSKNLKQQLLQGANATQGQVNLGIDLESKLIASEDNQLALNNKSVKELANLLATDGQTVFKDQLTESNQQLEQLIKQLKIVQEKLTLGQANGQPREISTLTAQDQTELAELKKMLTKLNGSMITQNSKHKLKQQRIAETSKLQHSKAFSKQSLQQSNTSKLAQGGNQQLEQLLKQGENQLGVTNEKINSADKGEQKGNLFNFTAASDDLVNGNQAVKQNNTQVDFGGKVDSRNIVNQVSNEIELLAKKPGKEVTLQLEPKTLGRLHVKIGVEDGTVTAKLIAENSQVKELLDGNLANLKNMLAQKDLQVNQFDVKYGGQDLAQEFGDSQQGFNFEQNNRGQEESNFEFELKDLSEDGLLVEDGPEQGEITTDNVDYVI